MNALIFLIETFSRLYLLTFLLRILLQVVRADFNHPFFHFIVQVTNPLVVPARRIIPSVRRFDLPTLVVLIALQLVVVLIVFTLQNAPMLPGLLLWAVIYRLISMVVWTLIICILIYVILSWIQPSYSPGRAFLSQIVDPVLRPARRILPPVGGVDLSPLIVTVLLWSILLLLGDMRTLFL